MVKDKDLYSKGIYYLVFIFLFLLEIWVLVNKRLTAPTNLEHQQEAIEVIKKAEVEATKARMLEAANKPEMQRKAEVISQPFWILK